MNDNDKSWKCRLHDQDRPLTNGDKGDHRIHRYLCRQKKYSPKNDKMKHFTTETRSRHLRIPSFMRFLWACLASLYGLSAFGQNVTISPSSGNLIAALTYENEVGFENGWSALWRHQQLPLTLHVSDKPDLTPSGVLKSWSLYREWKESNYPLTVSL